MKGSLPTVLVLLFVVSGMLLSAVSADNSNGEKSSETGTYVRGLICEIDPAGPTPAANIPVTLIYDDGSAEGKTAEGITDTDGFFEIQISETIIDETAATTVKFAFEQEGFSIFALPDTMTSLEHPTSFQLSEISPVAEIDLKKCTKDTSSEGKVVYVATNDVQHCILLGTTYVTVSITVTDSVTSNAIRNAEITLKNEENTYIGKTDSDGACIFSTPVLIGTYTITIKCDGYESYGGTIVITKTISKINLEMNHKEPTTYLGLTLYHLLMVIGVAVGLCLVIISYVLCTRTWKNVDKNDVNE